MSEFSGLRNTVFRGLRPGSRIAGYLIEEQIGVGGMAVVFRARDELLGRLAAMKVIAPSLAGDQEFRARFLRESRAVAAVDAPHIIPVYGAGEADGLLFIATRFVAGGDLEALLQRAGGRLAPDRAAALVTQVASALDAAHSAGLVHRDVKPQNILVDTPPQRPEHAYLSDFGISKGTGSSTRLTATGQFVGTPDYSAPEQIRGADVDGRADQYALACVAFVLLTGALPFQHQETMATLLAHVQDPVPPVTRLRPDLPPAVDGVLARALAKSPAARYGGCGEFAAALEAALAPPRPAAPDPFAWLAREAGASAPALASPPPAWPGPSSRPSPAPSGAEWAEWAEPSWPSGSTTAPPPRGGAHPGYASTVGAWNAGVGRDGAGRGHEPAAPGRSGQRRPRHLRTALVGGTAVVILAAAGVLYAARQPGSSHKAVSASSASLQRPSKPLVTATFTVPGDGTVDTTWMSPDAALIAASGQGPRIYVWNAARRSYVRTLTAPNFTIDNTVYSPVIDNLAFSANHADLIAVTYPNVPSGIDTTSESTYAVYSWNLATGKRTTVWSASTPSTVIFSNDNKTAMSYDNNVVSLLSLGPAMETAPAVTLPGGADQSYQPPYVLDYSGNRLEYHPTPAETDVWDFTQEKVIAKLDSAAYTVLSPDGKTILAANPTNTGATSRAAPMLWDVATQSNVTPADPRWKQQEAATWQMYSWNTYSTDGSVVVTKRAGGNWDLWSTTTRKYLATVTDPNYRKDLAFPLVGPRGSYVLILTAEKKVNMEDEYRQISVWETPLH